MATRTMSPVLLLGGSGQVGARAAKALRRLHPDLPIAIAGRDARRASEVAAEVGGPTTATAADVGRDDLGLERGASFSAVVALVKDEASNAVKRAQADGVPHVAFSDAVGEIGPVVAHALARPTRAPILMLGHAFGGAATLAALHLAQELQRVDAIAIGCVVDADDRGGPALQAAFEQEAQSGQAPLALQGGKWIWLLGDAATRRFVDGEGVERVGRAMPLPDVVSLAAATDAREIRVDIATRDAATGGAGHVTELIIEVSGRRHDGAGARLRYDIVDTDGLARLSAYGAVIATERLLGLAGGPPVGPGLYLPESVLDPARVVARLEELGARVRRTGQRL